MSCTTGSEGVLSHLLSIALFSNGSQALPIRLDLVVLISEIQGSWNSDPAPWGSREARGDGKLMLDTYHSKRGIPRTHAGHILVQVVFILRMLVA